MNNIIYTTFPCTTYLILNVQYIVPLFMHNICYLLRSLYFISHSLVQHTKVVTPPTLKKKVAGFYCSICEFLLSLLPIAKFYKKDNPPCKSEPTYLRDISHEIQHETSILHPRDLWRRIYSACTSKRWNLTYLF